MDEHFVQGVVGGVLNRHKNRTLDKKKIAVLSVEIAAVLERATQFTNVKEAQKAIDNGNAQKVLNRLIEITNREST